MVQQCVTSLLLACALIEAGQPHCAHHHALSCTNPEWLFSLLPILNVMYTASPALLKVFSWVQVRATRLDLVALIKERVMYALRQHRALDVAAATSDEVGLLAKLMAPKGRHQVDQQTWEAQLQLVLHLLAQSTGTPTELHAFIFDDLLWVVAHNFTQQSETMRARQC